MQVHAVPENERARDSHGRILPWGYASYTEGTENASRRIPQESGPFGKARKRGLSRSKTGTPGAQTREDKAKQENLKAIDDIFSSFKSNLKEQESQHARKPSGTVGLPMSASAPNLGADSNVGTGAPLPLPSIAKEPSEVILYGFGNEYQWAAIDHFERVSGGTIYEDYDRYPPHSKYNLSLSISRASSQRGLSQAALRKKNEYVGGEHWIKVTFDSREAAERAHHYSPHNIMGYEVHAEHYRGVNPSVGDIPLRKNQNGMSSVTASPQTISSTTLQAGTSTSETASSATATAPSERSRLPDTADARSPTGTLTVTATTTTALERPGTEPRPRQSTLRIRGAKPAVLLPPEQAFLPAAPRWQQTVGAIPVVGWIVGSGQGIIGDQVPRKEDGTFDEKNASVYWKFWYMIDRCFGTNVCGCWGVEED